MGTPEFAVESLKNLVEHGCNVVAVITAPDRPKGRGKKVAMSSVKEYALTQKLPVLQPTNLKDPSFIEELRTYRADVQIVVAFRMLPETVWSMPPLGSYNLHGSLLPDYRGAAPINWAIINGETITGVTTFKLQHEIDTGNILFQESVPIGPEDTVGDVYSRLMSIGGKLVLRTVNALQSGNIELKPQPERDHPKHAPKIYKPDCELDWNKTTHQIHNFVRGLSPYPTAWTSIGHRTVKVFHVVKSKLMLNIPVGHFSTDGKTYLAVKTSDGVVEITDLQLEGKKRMPVADLLRGIQFENQDNFT